jgi:hypothetical protein
MNIVNIMIINFNLYMKNNTTSKDGNLLENITMLDILLIFIDYERDGIRVDEKKKILT